MKNLKELPTWMLIKKQHELNVYTVTRNGYIELWQDVTNGDPVHIRTVSKMIYAKAMWRAKLDKLQLMLVVASGVIGVGMILVILQNTGLGLTLQQQAAPTIVLIICMINIFYNICTIGLD